jgi:hypothetical protein
VPVISRNSPVPLAPAAGKGDDEGVARGRIVMRRTSTTVEHRRRGLPTTDLGWWAIRLAGAAVVAGFAAPLFNLIPWVRYVGVPLMYGIAFGGAIGGGVLAAIAIIREKERAVIVFVALVPMLLYLVLIVAEIITGGEH